MSCFQTVKRFALIAAALPILAAMAGCSEPESPTSGSGTGKETIVIYSSAEDYRNTFLKEKLNEKFPNYTIVIEYENSGANAAKLKAQGKNTRCDIIFDLEYGYIEQVESLLADLSGYDFSIYEDDVVHESKKVLPVYKNGGCIAYNTQILANKGLAVPTSYDDLLKPEYKDLVSMPSAMTSGTGYMFLKNLVNVRGEDEAFDYFKRMSANGMMWTSSGSGPVENIVQGNAAIAFAMTAQASLQKKEGAPIELIFFDEGSPYSLYAMGMIDGRQDNAAVKAVFDYFYDELLIEEKQAYLPEKIYKNIDFFEKYENEFYPNLTSADYADMANNTADEKARLQKKWEDIVGS